ncbi:MAG: iron ABC transporter permease [bacterium]
MLKRFIFIGTIISFIIIALLPILWMFSNSLVVDGKLSLRNYWQVLSEARQFILLKNSLLVAGLSTFLAILIGVPIALFISRTNMPLRGVFTALCVVPLLVPPYINAIAWIHLLGQRGVLNIFLMRMLGLEEPLLTIYGIWGVIFVLTLSYFPFVTLLTASGLITIDPKLEEAGRLYISEFKVLRRISLKLVIPSILSGALFVFIFAIANFGVPALLRLHVYPIEVFSQFSAFFNFQAATATALPLVVITLGVVFLQRLYMKRRAYMTVSSDWSQPRIVNLGNWRWLAFIFCLLIISLSVILPVGVLIHRSASLEAYRTAFDTAKGEIANSLWFSGLGATMMVALGLVIAYIVERTKVRGRGILDISSILPYAIPGTVLGVGLISLWNRPVPFSYIYSTLAIVVLAYVARFIPFSVKALSSSFRQLDSSLEEAAVVSGISWRRTMTGIVIPLVKQGLFTAWLLAFVLCMGELAASILVCPAGSTTLPVRIFTLMHYGPDKLVAALCVILISIILLPIVIFGRMMRKTVEVFLDGTGRIEKCY